MVIVNSMRFPAESAEQVGRRFLEVAPPPDFMTLRGPYLKATDQGIRALEIYELDENKLALGIDYVAQRDATYYGIPGFTSEINNYFEAQEALKLVGLA